MAIKNYCKTIGFEIVGKLTRTSNYRKNVRCYYDEAMNEYLQDTITGAITIVTYDGSVI